MMRKRISVVGLALVLAVGMTIGIVSTAQAASWPDLPASVLEEYGITNDQVAQISQGFDNGLWRPAQHITRAQFVKMACAAFGIAQANPSVARFSDVRPGTTYYTYVEGAAAAGLVNGVSSTRFSPSAYITREQGLAIIGRAVAQATGEDLSTLYTPSELSAWLATLNNGSAVSPSLRSAVAFTANLGIVSSRDGDLDPRGWLTRIQAAAFLIRAKAPSVASVNPGRGGAGGGNTVTLTGTNFIDATAVKFGSADAQSFTIVSNTQITAVAPEGTVGETVNVVVVNPQGSSAVWEVTYTYTYGVPTVTSVSPTNGSPSGGNTAIITGTGFTGATAVQFGGIDANSYTVVSDTRITAVVPEGTAGDTVSVTVTGPEGTSIGDTDAGSYTYNYPAVTSVSPDHGPAAGGNTVTITGTGFASLTGSDAVMFGDNEARSYTVLSDTKLTAVVPRGTAGETIYVTVAGQDSDWTVEYTYNERPTITSLDPATGWEGDTVTIRGTNFDEDSVKVFFGGQQVDENDVMYISSKKLEVIVPAGADGNTVRVKVTTDDGTSPNTDADNFTYDNPAT
jgi:hypothetical protein